MKGYKVGSTIVWTVANNATAVIVRSLNGRLIAMVTERGNETYPEVGSTFTINDYMTHNVTKVDAPLRTVIYGGRRIHDGYGHYAVLSKSGKALTAISAGWLPLPIHSEGAPTLEASRAPFVGLQPGEPRRL